MTPPTVVHVTPTEAVPFIRSYNALMRTNAVDEYQVGEVVWCGIVLKGILRAVLGLQTRNIEDEVFVWGVFGDGSHTIDEALAGAYLSKVIDGLPWNLSGAILPKNVAQQKRALRMGWHKTDKQCYSGSDEELQEIWERSR